MNESRAPRLSGPDHPVDRVLRHRRTVDVQVYRRADGLWEMQARLVDVKPHDIQLATGVRAGGDPVHDLTLHLLFDTTLTVLDAQARSDRMPYPGHCDAHGDAYRRLIGLNFLRGFRHQVKERLGGVRGCTHLSEMAQALPTAAVQALAGEVIDTQGGDGPDAVRPFQIDRCHALRADGEAVRIHYPRWFRGATSEGPRAEGGVTANASL